MANTDRTDPGPWPDGAQILGQSWGKQGVFEEVSFKLKNWKSGESVPGRSSKYKGPEAGKRCLGWKNWKVTGWSLVHELERRGNER